MSLKTWDVKAIKIRKSSCVNARGTLSPDLRMRGGVPPSSPDEGGRGGVPPSSPDKRVTPSSPDGGTPIQSQGGGYPLPHQSDVGTPYCQPDRGTPCQLDGVTHMSGLDGVPPIATG